MEKINYKPLIPLVLTLALSLTLQVSFLSNQDQLTEWLSKFGIWIIAIYVPLQMMTIIIAPLGGLFLQIAILAVFGPAFAFTLIYIVSTPTYLINFYLSKRFGRPIVEKIIGKEALKTIDIYADHMGLPALIILKLLQGNNFDFISYAAGLTRISWKHFIWVNFLLGIPSILLSYFIFSRFESFTFGIIALMTLTYVLLLISYLISRRYLKKKLPDQEDLGS